MKIKHITATVAALVVLLGACGPAATPTAPPSTPPAGAAPTVARASPTPTQPSPAATATPTARPASLPTPTPTAGPQYGGVLRYAAYGDIDGWDVFRNIMAGTRTPMGFVYNRLVQFNPGPPECSVTPYEPELAESWQWLDDKTLEIKLRRGVKWQNKPPANGRELVASDVLYSTKVWPKASFLKAQLENVEKVTAPDKYTVRFSLKQPFSGFVGTVVAGEFPYVVAEDVWGDDLEITQTQETVGTGPFQWVKRDPGVSIVLEKNPTYWRQGLPYLDGVKFYVMPERSTQAAALRAGKADTAMMKVPAAVKELEATAPQLGLHRCQTSAPVGLVTRADKAPYSDVRVRRAISMAIDRQALIHTVYLGMAEPVYTSVLPFFNEHYLPFDQLPTETRRYLEYRPEEAKQLLAQAGYATGFKATVSTVERFPDQRQMAEAIVAMLANVGIQARLEVLDYTRMQQVVYQGGMMDNMAVTYLGTATEIHGRVYDNFVPGPRNRGHVDDPDLVRLSQEQMVTVDAQKRRDLIRRHQLRQLETTYYVMLPSVQEVMVTSPELKGLYYKPFERETGDVFYGTWLAK